MAVSTASTAAKDEVHAEEARDNDGFDHDDDDDDDVATDDVANGDDGDDDAMATREEQLKDQLRDAEAQVSRFRRTSKLLQAFIVTRRSSAGGDCAPMALQHQDSVGELMGQPPLPASRPRFSGSGIVLGLSALLSADDGSGDAPEGAPAVGLTAVVEQDEEEEEDDDDDDEGEEDDEENETSE